MGCGEFAMGQQIQFSRKPTVAHIMPWAGLGGVEIATLRMVEATRDHVRNVAFCLPDAAAVRNAFEEAGIETVTCAPPEPSLRHFARYYSSSQSVAHELRRVGADIVHFAEEKGAYHNSLAAVLASCKRVGHFRVSNPQFPFRQRLCLRPIQSFIFVSQEARDTFGIPVPDSKARVIYDAIAVPDLPGPDEIAEVRRELGIPPNAAIVGTVARVSPQKDYFTLAAAAVEVLQKHPDARFLIVGDNSRVDLNRKHYQEVSAKLNELGIAGSFIFTGHRDDVPRLIAAMDIAVLSTHREGFPLSILETMALAKPVVATSVGGIPEIIRPGVTGFLHEHGNSHQLAQAINSLIEDHSLIEKIGNTAREHVRIHYSREKYTREILQAYADVLGAGSSASLAAIHAEGS